MNKSIKQRAYLALGGNLGEPRQALISACQSLREHPQIELQQASSLYRTPPVGGPSEQPNYLNAVIEITTTLSAKQLLEICLQIENSAGRTREVRWAARTLDIDLLLVGNLTCSNAALSLPHPRLQERQFVLLPLAEIAPELHHPQLNRSISALLEDLPVVAEIVRLKGKWIDHD